MTLRSSATTSRRNRRMLRRCRAWAARSRSAAARDRVAPPSADRPAGRDGVRSRAARRERGAGSSSSSPAGVRLPPRAPGPPPAPALFPSPSAPAGAGLPRGHDLVLVALGLGGDLGLGGLQLGGVGHAGRLAVELLVGQPGVGGGAGVAVACRLLVAHCASLASLVVAVVLGPVV